MSYLQIANGPSKFDLMMSLFGANRQIKPTVVFTDDEGHNYTASVLGVSSADGSGEHWKVSGQLHDIYVVGGNEHGGQARLSRRLGFSGMFSTADREGYFHLD